MLLADGRLVQEDGAYRPAGDLTSLAVPETLTALITSRLDRLTPEEASQLASELPMLVRGFYYEGWSPAHKPKKLHTKQEFLDYVAEGLPDDPELDPERVARGVFAILAKRISKGEVRDIKLTLPQEIRDLWPSSI